MTFGPNICCDKHVNCFIAPKTGPVEWTLLLNPATTRQARIIPYLDNPHSTTHHIRHLCHTHLSLFLVRETMECICGASDQCATAWTCRIKSSDGARLLTLGDPLDSHSSIRLQPETEVFLSDLSSIL